jgi:protocatechuate 3,4-dioxygenase beta subunit
MTHERTQGNPARTAWSRREALRLLGTAGAAALAGQWPVHAQRAGPPLDCVVTPEQTEGPYFVDERLRRADLRIDPTTEKVKPGLPLRLRIHVSRVDGSACSPLPGAFVDVWQCDALGVYSDIRDFNGQFDTRGQKFLRGYQVTDRSGAVEFATIYPGWYRGRAVHVHVKVRFPDGARRSQEFTSQLYFDDAITDQVHARSPYNTKGPRDTRNHRDHIFRRRDSGSGLLLRLRPHGQGYLSTFAIGLIASG